MLTQYRLKEALDYDEVTGLFTWKVSKNWRVPIGSVAGASLHGYIRIMVDRESFAAHRLAWLYMTGEWPADQVDHINHVRYDNRWSNLQESTNQENQRNCSVSKNNTSGVVGVSWHKLDKRWRPSIRIDDVLMSLGSFKDKWDAICARKSAENSYGFHVNHGKSNKTNGDGE